MLGSVLFVDVVVGMGVDVDFVCGVVVLVVG